MLLPREMWWPVLNNFHSAVDFLPYYVGSVSPNNGTIEWKRACFYGNQDITEGDCDESGLADHVIYLTHGVSVFHAVSPPSSDVRLNTCGMGGVGKKNQAGGKVSLTSALSRVITIIYSHLGFSQATILTSNIV